ELGKQLHVVELNIREFSDPLVNWIHVFNSALCGIALYFESLFDRVLIPTDTSHRYQQPLGASRMVDMLWSSEALEIMDHGSRLTRFERTRLLAKSPLAQRTLRVCYMNYDQTYNCGRCPKCISAMITLEALGVREKFTTFPSEFDFSALEDYIPAAQVLMVFWEDLLRGVEECDREDLAEVVRPVLERGERNLADPALIAAREEASSARAEAAAAREDAAAAQAKVREVLGSTSWRLTEPLRRVGIGARKVRSRFRSRADRRQNGAVGPTTPLSERVVAANLTYLNRPKIELLESCIVEVQERAVPGDFLEMGIALGGSGILIANLMEQGRHYHGYDVFGTIPPPSEEDPPLVHERYRTIVEGRSEGIGGDTYYGYIDDLYDRVVASFVAFGQPVDGDRVQLHRGLFEETLHPEGEVAFAHVDCDWYEPVKLCIERIWPHLPSGGVMVFDDYTEYGGCTRAVDEFVAASDDATLRTREPSAVLVKA
ncbi:MAG TPA: TylF/MycF/NovP-related O-methyltransferase, partial [Solirubrobacterales bacterium]